ncbi:hypothetical protein QYF36_018176 [Acer negundo]|nr:hypothetical protein QYF36_018176 [Acer negundo]
MSEPVEKWARHAFEPSIKADHISNNMCECFNSWIREDRDKPVLQLLEILRRKLMINGLPCMHVIAVYMYKREFAHDHVHWYYSKQTWQLTYDGVINPIPDESRWPEVHYEIIELPVKKAKVGKPKKKRSRVPDEPRATNATFSKRCSKWFKPMYAAQEGQSLINTAQARLPQHIWLMFALK